MKIKNETALPNDLVKRVLESALKAVSELIPCPNLIGADMFVEVRNGPNHGVSTGLLYTHDKTMKGCYVETCWAINHRDRKTHSSKNYDYASGLTPDIPNALDIYALCAHEFAHNLEDINGICSEPSPGHHSKRPEEIRAREIERKVLFNLTEEQWGLLRELAQACETFGNPDKRKNRYPILFGKSGYLERKIRQTWSHAV